MKYMIAIRRMALSAWIAAAAAWAAPVAAQDAPVYRCPGNPALYTNQLSAREAHDKGCRTIEGAPISIMQSPRPRTPAAPSSASDPNNRISSVEQRGRDTERRSILESELRSAQDKLAELQKEFNNGQPERRGDERNYAKYETRVAELKANIERKQDDIAAIKREISKLPQ